MLQNTVLLGLWMKGQSRQDIANSCKIYFSMLMVHYYYGTLVVSHLCAVCACWLAFGNLSFLPFECVCWCYPSFGWVDERLRAPMVVCVSQTFSLNHLINIFWNFSKFFQIKFWPKYQQLLLIEVKPNAVRIFICSSILFF